MRAVLFIFLFLISSVAHATQTVLGYPNGYPAVVCAPNDKGAGCTGVSGGGTNYWGQSGNNIYPATIGNNVGIGTATPGAPLAVNGNILLNSSGGQTLTSNGTSLTLSETGDTYGTVSLLLENRNGLNGALFYNPALDLTDFSFETSSTATQNFRYEHRSSFLQNSANTNGEFQMLIPSGPTFFAFFGTQDSGILTGNFGIGQASPAQKLDVNGIVKMTGFSLPTNASAGYVLTSSSVGIGTWMPATGGGGSSFWSPNGQDIYNTNSGNVGIGTINPQGLLATTNNILDDGSGNIKGTSATLSSSSTYSVGNIYTSGMLQDDNSGANLEAVGNYFSFSIYAYITVGSTKVYSATPSTVIGTDDNSGNNFYWYIYWSPVSGAYGYKIVINEDDYNGYYDYGIDVGNVTSFYYDGSYTTESAAVITPSSPATFHNTALTVNGNATVANNLNVINSALVGTSGNGVQMNPNFSSGWGTGEGLIFKSTGGGIYTGSNNGATISAQTDNSGNTSFNLTNNYGLVLMVVIMGRSI